MKDIKQNKTVINSNINCPSTHGALRFSAETDGGKIIKFVPELGYTHRGLEKAAQNRLFSQYLLMTEKIDYLADFFYTQAYLSATEELLEIELPKNAQYIRVLTMELNRISSHLAWLADFAQSLGIPAPVSYAFNLRNEILNIFEKITGGRISHNYYVFGGVRNKISNDILNDILDFIKNFNQKFKILKTVMMENPVFLDRTKDLGIITTEIALPYSITGVNLRASGLALDFRKEKPYLVYNELEFIIPTAFEGDCYSRCKLRMDEIEISLNLVKQCAEWLLANQDGAINLNINQTDIKPKTGKAASWTESARGLVMCNIITDGSKKPKRLKWRTPSFYAIQLLEKIAVHCALADLPALISSLDIVITEADR